MGFRFILTDAWLRALRNFEAHSAIQQMGYDHKFDASAALANMGTAVRLCSVYPGDNAVVPHKPFSSRFDDLSLRNIMVRSWVLCSSITF